MARLVTCKHCTHIFLSYGSHCPNCGAMRPRQGKNWTALCAVTASLVALGVTYLFVREIDRVNRPEPSPSRATPASSVGEKLSTGALSGPSQTLKGTVAQRNAKPRP